MELQSKLLSVIQNKEVIRVGSSKPIKFDIRLICATNIPIYDYVAAKKFRQDLLYRVNTVEIHFPPLRQRKGDIPLLVEHFLSIYNRKYNKPGLEVDENTLKKFESYAWPGNIRELQHVIERSVILCETNVLKPSDILFSEPDHHLNGDNTDNFNLEDVEKQVEGNISKAAKELGLTRTSLYRRMEKHGL